MSKIKFFRNTYILESQNPGTSLQEKWDLNREVSKKFWDKSKFLELGSHEGNLIISSSYGKFKVSQMVEGMPVKVLDF